MQVTPDRNWPFSMAVRCQPSDCTITIAAKEKPTDRYSIIILCNGAEKENRTHHQCVPPFFLANRDSNQSINQSKNYTLWMDIGKWKTTQLNQKAGQKGFFPGTVDYRPLHNQQITPLEGQLKWIMSSLWPQWSRYQSGASLGKHIKGWRGVKQIKRANSAENPLDWSDESVKLEGKWVTQKVGSLF